MRVAPLVGSLSLLCVLVLGVNQAQAQCPTAGLVRIEVCNEPSGGGTIRAYTFDGGVPGGYILFSLFPAIPVSAPFGPVTVTTLTTLPPGAVAGVEFGGVANGDYVIRINCSPTGFVIVGGFGISVTSANNLKGSINLISSDCDPGTVGTGQLRVTATDGTAPYSVQWAGPTSVPSGVIAASGGSQTTAANLNGGAYTATITDAANCVRTVNFSLPISSVPNAGTDVSTCSSTAALNATPVSSPETGTWSGPSGVTFSDVNSPVATASNLPSGASILRWTINSPDCASGNFDEVVVTRDPPPSITLGSFPSVCEGTTSALLPYTATTGSPDQFSIVYGAAALAAGFINVTNQPLGVSPITLIVPAGAAPAVYTANLTIRNSTTTCSSASIPFTITVQANPTITMGAFPSVCQGTTTANLTYTATTQTPTEYSLDFDAVAEVQLFADVANAALPVSPIGVTVPAGAAPGVYNATLRVRNAGICVSVSTPVTITVNASPAITPGANPSVCAGVTTANLTYTSSGSPDRYTLNFDGAAEAQGFADVNNVALPASPIVISVPAGAAGGTYNATLQVQNTTTGCISTIQNITVTIVQPSITLGSFPSVCEGTTSALLPYTATTGSPDQFSIVYGAAAVAAGFINVTNQPLGVSPITLIVPAGAAPAVYTANLTIRNSTTTCSSASIPFTITVQASPTITVPAGNVVVCQTSGAQNLLTLVSATPAGGTFTFSGTGVSGSSFNPTGLSGLVTINVSYSNGGCSAPPRTFRFDVVAAASLETSTTTVCPTDADVDLTTLVTATPPGGTFTFSGAPGITGNIFDPTPNAGTSPTIAISYVLGGCSATGAFQVTVRAASDPLCGGGGGGGTGTCATVVVTPLPSPATCTNSDGRIIFRIKPFVPAVNPDGVRIEITGVSPTNQTISRTNFNDSTFTNLPIGTYDYEIDYGSAACKKTGQVTIDRSGTIGVPVATNVTSPTCFGEATGSLRLDVPGETGNVLQWSFDGGVTDPWKNFSAGNQVTGIPAGLAPTFQRVISVRRNATDPCFSSVVVAIPETASAITANLVPANASCNNNDGSITVTGLPVGTFTFRLNGTPITLPANGVINNLVANNYTLRVTAASGCFRDFTANVTFPGFVPTTTPVVSPPDCTGGGLNGTISFSITAPGAYTVGFTQDPVAAPTNFFNPGGLNVTIPNLTSGFWYIWIRPAGVFCETKLGPLNLSGTVRVAFQLTVTDEICFGSQGSIQLTAIQGAPNQPFAYELIKDGAALPTAVITFAQSVTPFTIAGLAPGNYRLVLTQNQSSLVPACTTPIASAPRTFRITGPSRALDTLAVEREISLPDQATGSMRIGIQESTFEPYEVRVELISPVFPSQSFLMDWRAAARNPQTLRMELVVNNLYAGVYKVSLRDANGCLKEYEVEVKVDTALFVPNIFTPNGDGFNDTFFIRNLPSEAKLEISNRWGKSVYQSNAYQNDWDANGISEGLYFYRLSFGDQAVSGWVEILRGRTD